jgi:hypothetical protein
MSVVASVANLSRPASHPNGWFTTQGLVSLVPKYDSLRH